MPTLRAGRGRPAGLGPGPDARPTGRMDRTGLVSFGRRYLSAKATEAVGTWKIRRTN